MSGIKEAERELEKVEEVLAMADRAIQISRLEHERLTSDLIVTEQAAEWTDAASERRLV